MNGIFKGYKSAKPTSTVLAIGTHIVTLVKIFMIDSFTNINGSAKDDSVWNEPTPQLAVQLGNDKGVITSRLNGVGYVHTDAMDPEEMKTLELVDVEGYAAKDLGDGKFQRVVSEDNTEACSNILNRFFHACSVPEGSTIEQLMVMAKDNKIQLEIEVEANEWDGKTRSEVKSFKPVTEERLAELDLK